MSVFTTWLPIVQEVVGIIALGVGAYVALAGLNTWKAQIKANAEYDLARRVLKAVYKVRDVLRQSRIPAYGVKQFVKLKELQEPAVAKLDEATASLQVELLEAEAIWGDNTAYNSLISFIELVEQFEISYHIFYLPRESKTQDRNTDVYRTLFDDHVYGPPDVFGEKVKSTVQEVEDFLRPKLRLKQGMARKKKAAKSPRPKKS